MPSRTGSVIAKRKRAHTEQLSNLKMTMAMPKEEQIMLSKLLQENTDDSIRCHLVQKYNKYYRHWQDLNILVAVFAVASLILAIVEWETSFDKRGDDGTNTSAVSFFTDLIVGLVSLMGLFAIILKYYFESIWQ